MSISPVISGTSAANTGSTTTTLATDYYPNCYNFKMYHFIHEFGSKKSIMMVRSVVIFALLGIQLSFHEAEAGMNKACMTEMEKMMKTQTKLIVPCIESLGLSTAAEKKEKALVYYQNHFNFTISSFGDLIKLQFFLPVPFLMRGVFWVDRKLDRFKNVLAYFLQCVMKCVMIKANMLAPDGAVDMDLAQKLLDDLPDALKEKATDVIQACGHHAAGLEPNEASCESYREFVSCMLDVALKMCVE